MATNPGGGGANGLSGRATKKRTFFYGFPYLRTKRFKENLRFFKWKDSLMNSLKSNYTYMIYFGIAKYFFYFQVIKCHDHIELLVNSGGDLIFFRQEFIFLSWVLFRVVTHIRSDIAPFLQCFVFVSFRYGSGSSYPFR